jgi:hypothetical protein
MTQQSTFHRALWVARGCLQVGCAETHSVAGRWERGSERPTGDIEDPPEGIEDVSEDIEDPPEDKEEKGLSITHHHCQRSQLRRW